MARENGGHLGEPESLRPGALPGTGAPDRTVVLALGGGLLPAAGGAGLWPTRRRPAARH
ncbi:hypothetical protein [Streptomyces sp. NPDC001070]